MADARITAELRETGESVNHKRVTHTVTAAAGPRPRLLRAHVDAAFSRARARPTTPTACRASTTRRHGSRRLSPTGTRRRPRRQPGRSYALPLARLSPRPTTGIS
ncbi:hypothetical protein [Streptomyces griseoruber]|uniref:hypothetical protein n=1 Tax=Streptomyces griseoruber TaxID=1943 RepID=UPI000ADD6D0D|nr:hypothetical protein [Streptomyces griseoruber]